MFNPQARWDRELPCQDEERFGTHISMTCVMEKGTITPEKFFWKGRAFHITKIHFRWKDRQGQEELFHYSVETESGTYEIILRASAFSWHLRRLIGP